MSLPTALCTSLEPVALHDDTADLRLEALDQPLASFSFIRPTVLAFEQFGHPLQEFTLALRELNPVDLVANHDLVDWPESTRGFKRDASLNSGPWTFRLPVIWDHCAGGSGETAPLNLQSDSDFSDQVSNQVSRE